MAVDLEELLRLKQGALLSQLEAGRGAFAHPTAIGDAIEIDWAGAVGDFLPGRYAVSKAFVIDADGEVSEQIDLVIHDAHYCPLLFEQGGHRYIPAESVYGVFETKPELSREHVLYAGDKVASVRRLRRTSLPIVHAGGEYPPRPPFRILGGILTVTSSWNPPLGDPLTEALGDVGEPGRLDLGCSAAHGAFTVTYPNDEGTSVVTSEPEAALIFFLANLFSRLQQLGTVPAIDLAAYARGLQA